MRDPIRFPDWRELLDELLSFLPAVWRQSTGKATQRILVAYSLAMEGLYGALQRVIRMAFPATSEGEWLRAIATSWGMTVFAGVPATTTLQFRAFDPPTEPIQIPIGTTARSRNGTIYKTTENAILSVGEELVLVPAVADVPGLVGNAEANDIVGLINPIAGIDEVINPVPATGGIDAEPDGAIRARIPIHLATLHRATVPATEGIIVSDRVNFPDVTQFLTERNYLIPGYFRGYICDATSGETYRARNWQAYSLSGVYWVDIPPEWTVTGLLEPGWPCQRYGETSRALDGTEVWAQSTSLLDLPNGNFRWRVENNRLYAYATGGNLNEREITIRAGLVDRVYQTLRQNWVAAGVHFDILVPLQQWLDLEMSFQLEPGFTENAVKQQLRFRIRNYAFALPMGGTYSPDQVLEQILQVPGVLGARVDSPIVSITPPSSTVIRFNNIVINRLN